MTTSMSGSISFLLTPVGVARNLPPPSFTLTFPSLEAPKPFSPIMWQTLQSCSLISPISITSSI